MGDYTFNKKDKETFIMKYEIGENNNIIIHFASGKDYIIPYTVSNEKKILEIMRQQVLDVDYDMMREKHSDATFYASLFLAISFLFILVVYICIGEIVEGDLFACSAIGIGSGSAILGGLYLGRCFVYGRKKYDLKKNEWFLSVEKMLNEGVKKWGKALCNVNEETRKLVESRSFNQSVFTLNNIDHMSHEELEEILNSIELARRFNFEYPNEVQEKTLSIGVKKI